MFVTDILSLNFQLRLLEQMQGPNEEHLWERGLPAKSLL